MPWSVSFSQLNPQFLILFNFHIQIFQSVGLDVVETPAKDVAPAVPPVAVAAVAVVAPDSVHDKE
jgi:hypothetical protein